jgi:hypothetical protein
MAIGEETVIKELLEAQRTGNVEESLALWIDLLQMYLFDLARVRHFNRSEAAELIHFLELQWIYRVDTMFAARKKSPKGTEESVETSVIKTFKEIRDLALDLWKAGEFAETTTPTQGSGDENLEEVIKGKGKAVSTWHGGQATQGYSHLNRHFLSLAADLSNRLKEGPPHSQQDLELLTEAKPVVDQILDRVARNLDKIYESLKRIESKLAEVG